MVKYSKCRLISLVLSVSIFFSAGTTQCLWPFSGFFKPKPKNTFQRLKSTLTNMTSKCSRTSKASLGLVGAGILGSIALWFSGYFKKDEPQKGPDKGPDSGTNKGFWGKFSKKKKSDKKDDVERLPIVGGREYDIACFGVEKLYPFDSTKYGTVEKYLLNKFNIGKNRLTKPRMVTDAELLLVHTRRYLDSLKKSSVVERIVEVPGIGWVPNFLLRRYLLNPMKLATGGTIQAAQLALQHGWAVNLGGGYHHAKRDSGGGFCVYADIPIAVEQLWKQNPDLRVMVIDLDAHQGNGHEAVFAGDPRVKIFDMYNQYIYPADWAAKMHIDFDVPVDSGITGPEYIDRLRKELDNAFDQLDKQNEMPDLIIFNAGTDPLDGDRLGAMRVSQEHMIERDDIVFEYAKNRKVPIVYLTSGGYTSQSAKLIGKSLKNVFRKHLGMAKGQKIEGVPKLFE